MDYVKWKALSREMAMGYLLLEAADKMIPSRDARPRIEAMRDLSDANTDQSHPDVQRWRSVEYDMGAALIALENLGYRIEKS